MYKALSPGAIGVNLPFEQASALAASEGFQGIYVDIGAAAERGAENTRALLADRGLRPAGFGLPVEFRAADEAFRQSIAGLDRLAAVAARLGCYRCSTWVPSWHDELAFDELYVLWRGRFAEAASILKEHGIRLGLEFLGPATLRKGRKTEFVHTMRGMLDLCADVGTGNVGLLLDSWHAHTSGATLDELADLTNDDVVDVHVNDAPAGVAMEDYLDNNREIPGATGVIDLPGFLRALGAIGYDGPVMAEPFSEQLNAMDDAQAVTTIAGALDDALAAAGVATL